MGLLRGLMGGFGAGFQPKGLLTNVLHNNAMDAEMKQSAIQPVDFSQSVQKDRMLPGGMVPSIAPSKVPTTPDMSTNPISRDPSQPISQAQKIAEALGQVESSGNYNALGPTVHGAHALGKYQVMPSNVGPWSKAATGVESSPQDFLKDPKLQDRVVVYRINALLQQGYSPQDIASIHLSGKPLSGNQRKDLATGISVPQYVQKFNRFFGA